MEKFTSQIMDSFNATIIQAGDDEEGNGGDRRINVEVNFDFVLYVLAKLLPKFQFQTPQELEIEMVVGNKSNQENQDLPSAEKYDLINVKEVR